MQYEKGSHHPNIALERRAVSVPFSGNPNHDYPNILMFTNLDSQCGYNDLYAVLTGDFLGKGGIGEGVYDQYAKGRVMSDKMSVDVFVWWNGSEKISLRVVRFSAEPRHYARVCDLLHFDPSKHRKVG